LDQNITSDDRTGGKTIIYRCIVLRDHGHNIRSAAVVLVVRSCGPRVDGPRPAYQFRSFVLYAYTTGYYIITAVQHARASVASTGPLPQLQNPSPFRRRSPIADNALWISD